jgi:hypothetical protein
MPNIGQVRIPAFTHIHKTKWKAMLAL